MPNAPQATIGLTGIWHDSTGAIYEVTQQGSNFAFMVSNRSTGYTARGSGTLNGAEFRGSYQSNLPSIGSGAGAVSPNGRQISGQFLDSSTGRYALTLYR